MDKKYFILILIGVGILAGVLMFIFFYNGNIQKSSVDNEQNNLINETSDNLTEQGKQRLRKIFSNTFKFLLRENSILAFSQNGEITEIDFNGNVIKKLREGSGNLVEVVFSKNKSKAILSIINADNKLTQNVFDLESFKEIGLISNVFSSVFSPKGDQIAFHYYDPYSGINNISVSNVDGSKIKILFNLKMYDINLVWPEENKIFIFNSPSFLVKSEIYILDISKKELKTAGISYNGLAVKDFGDSILYSVSNALGKDLKVYYYDLDRSWELPIMTVSDKCELNQEEIICASPGSSSSISQFPDNYYKYKYNSNERIVSYNLRENSGRVMAVLSDFLERTTDIINIFSNPEFLLFIDKKDNGVYRLNF